MGKGRKNQGEKKRGRLDSLSQHADGEGKSGRYLSLQREGEENAVGRLSAGNRKKCGGGTGGEGTTSDQAPRKKRGSQEKRKTSKQGRKRKRGPPQLFFSKTHEIGRAGQGTLTSAKFCPLK